MSCFHASELPTAIHVDAMLRRGDNAVLLPSLRLIGDVLLRANRYVGIEQLIIRLARSKE
jgi:hypothetical protein